MGMNLTLHDLQRRMIRSQVMKQLHHHPAILQWIVGDKQLHQRRPAYIQSVMTRIKPPLQLFGNVFI